MHDAKTDFYGTTLATGSSDCSVKIFSVINKKQLLVADLKQHQGPVWGVAWSHPMYGNLLASCSYDRTVNIWQQINSKWQMIYAHNVHESSVNCIEWAPHEIGLILVCGSADGSISLLYSNSNVSCPGTEACSWDSKMIKGAHSMGVNSVSWSPSSGILSSLKRTKNPCRRFVSAGCDNLIKIWCECPDNALGWREECRLEEHNDWVRDVAWSPSLSSKRQIIASCGQDGKLIIWERTQPDDLQPMESLSTQMVSNQWIPNLIHTYNDVCWHLSWSITGNLLAVATADNNITIWKENLDRKWISLSEIQRGSNPLNASSSSTTNNNQQPGQTSTTTTNNNINANINPDLSSNNPEQQQQQLPHSNNQQAFFDNNNVFGGGANFMTGQKPVITS